MSNVITKPGKMTGFTQTLVVDDWPLNREGDRKRFPCMVGLGVFPNFEKGEGYFCYADFASASNYVRFRLPDDRELINALFHVLKTHMDKAAHNRRIEHGVWIEKYYDGYRIELDMMPKSAL